MSRKLTFNPLDELGEVRIYYNGFLPHWRQTGCTYFVTFRLADSVPRAVLAEWNYERDTWLSVRGVDPKTRDWKKALETLSKEDRRLLERHFAGRLLEYLDRGHGDCVLRKSEIRQVVADSMLFFHSKKLDTGDFVVMPNHVHALLTPYAGFELEDVLHSIKSYTANQINNKLRRSGTLWMEESYDHIVCDGEELLRIQQYIRVNPEMARLAHSDYCIHEADYDC